MSAARLAIGIAPLLISMIFATALVGIDRLAFRDVSHFYTPLYDYVAMRGGQQWLPLWNPLDGTGMPLIGESTTAFFYPIRYLLFALPLDTDVAISWYVVIHLVLASVNAFALSRLAGCQRQAAIIASIAYPLSGSILFLYCNPPFLVGAAWLPLALASLLIPLPWRPSNRILIGAVAMSMMILGGDPQGALHAVIIAVAVSTVQVCRRRLDRVSAITLLAVPLLAAVLSAPQIAASVSWSRQSERMLDRGDRDWLQVPEPGSKRQVAFSYSLPPWHLLETVTPRAFGSLFPINRRLGKLLPNAERMWTPSIYFGLLMFAILALRLGSRRLDRWSAVAIVSLLAAFGNFGLVWLLQPLTPWFDHLHGAVGGVYWSLYHWVPGYETFRYPAKWLVPFTLTAIISASRWLDQLDAIQWRKLKSLSLVMLFAAGLVTVLLLIFATEDRYETSAAVDRFWGPLQLDLAWRELHASLLQTMLFATALAVVAHRVIRGSLQSPTAMLLLTGLIAIDLTVAGYGLIGRVDRTREAVVLAKTDEEGIKTIGQVIVNDPASARTARWLRTQNQSGWPTAWRKQSHLDRILEVEASSRRNWLGRWHLAERQGVFNSMVSIRSYRLAQFWQASSLVLAELPQEQHAGYWNSIRQWLSIAAIRQSSSRSVVAEENDSTLHLSQIVCKFERQTDAARMDWRWKVETNPLASPQPFAERLAEIASEDDKGLPRVEGRRQRIVSASQRDPTASIRVLNDDPERLELQVSSTSVALLSRSVLQDGHWKARFRANAASPWRNAAVRRVDALRQGITIPAGNWIVEFRYRPNWIVWTLPIAALAWLAVVAKLAKSFGNERPKVLDVRDYFPMQKRPKTRSRMSSV